MPIPLTEFVLSLFGELAKNDIQYCVLRNYQKLPDENIGSDIDVLIQERSLKKSIELVSKIEGIRITDLICRTYVVSIFIEGVQMSDGGDSVQLDYFTKLSWKGFEYLDVDKLLGRSTAHITHPLIRKPAPEHEALSSFFASYLVGGWIKDRYQNFVRNAFSHYEKQVFCELSPWAGPTLAQKLIVAVKNDQRNYLISLLPKLKRRLVLYHMMHRPLHSFMSFAQHVVSELRIRFTSKTLRQIVMLGMDGAGKTTVINGLLEKMGARTKGYQVIHLKHAFCGQKTYGQGPVCSDPHGLPPRSKLVSALKLLSWVAMYHIKKTFHGRKNATLIIWDRYIYDVVVDPMRYRIDLPYWLLDWFAKMAPRPQAVILLDVPVEIAYKRKPEVAVADMHKIRSAYLGLVNKLPTMVVVGTEGDVTDTVREVVEFVTRSLNNEAKKKIDRLA